MAAGATVEEKSNALFLHHVQEECWEVLHLKQKSLQKTRVQSKICKCLLPSSKDKQSRLRTRPWLFCLPVHSGCSVHPGEKGGDHPSDVLYILQKKESAINLRAAAAPEGPPGSRGGGLVVQEVSLMWAEEPGQAPAPQGRCWQEEAGAACPQQQSSPSSHEETRLDKWTVHLVNRAPRRCLLDPPCCL